MHTDDIFDHYLAEGIIDSVDCILKSGKEAVVYACAPGPKAEAQAVALKVYKDIEYRSFRNMGDYLDGRVGTMIRKRRDILHMYSDPAAMQANWVWAELEALKTMHGQGLPVPRPYGSTGRSLAMELVGNGLDEAAPRLRDCRLSRDQAEPVFGRLREVVRLMLGLDLIHGDLSAYNILYHDDQPYIIDLPQAVDARYNSQAQQFLRRDCVNLYAYFSRFGFGDEIDARCYADSLWEDYVVNRLYA